MRTPTTVQNVMRASLPGLIARRAEHGSNTILEPFNGPPISARGTRESLSRPMKDARSVSFPLADNVAFDHPHV
jgi:hypothetical protein